MSDTVISVQRATQIDNNAAMMEKMDELIAAHYSGPAWERQGPNWMVNRESGEAVNLNMEAIKALQAEGPRMDAMATVETAEGERKQVFIPQDAVIAVGGDMKVLKNNLQKVLSEGSGLGDMLSNVPVWAWVAGGGAALYLMTRPKRHAFGRH
jgi:NTP pyrophosphatase (non-canonical NTP hydrolase)